MCCVVFVVVLLRCCFCCKAITFIYVFAYLAVRQAVRQSTAVEVAAAPVEVATQQSPRLTLNIFCLISMLVTHILTVRYPLSFTPSLSLSFSSSSFTLEFIYTFSRAL